MSFWKAKISDKYNAKFDVILTVHHRYYVEIKCQLDATEVFIADFIACSTCFGHHYAHHQELKSNLKTTARNTTGSNHCIILLSS